MFVFTSVHRKHTIFGKPLSNGELEYIVQFTPVGAVGQFITDDEELANKLRQHPDYNTKFMEIGVLKETIKSNVIQGIRSSETRPELGQEHIDPKEFVEYGELKAKLLKNDGSYRKDASEVDIKRFEELKSKIEKEK